MVPLTPWQEDGPPGPPGPVLKNNGKSGTGNADHHCINFPFIKRGLNIVHIRISDVFFIRTNMQTINHGGREKGGGMGFIATYLAQRPSWS